MSLPEGQPPFVAVHVVIFRQAICHDCGWESALVNTEAEAETEAQRHEH